MLKFLLKYSVFFFLLIISSRSFAGKAIDSEGETIISERVHLHIDRKVYIAGENLLFSFYLIDTKANHLASYSSIGYVCLRNQNGDIIGKSQVRLEKGIASGAIYLLDTLKTGYYQVSAYTNFMRNGSEDIFYKSQVLIVNRFEKDFFELINQNQNISLVTDTNKFISVAPINTAKLNVIPDKDSFGRREKVGIKLSITDNTFSLANLTISVVENNSVEQFEKGGNVKLATTARASVINRKNQYFLAEDKYAELQGLVINEHNGKRICHQTLYLSTPDSFTNLKYAVTDSQGIFRFAIPDYYSGRDIFIKINENAEVVEEKEIGTKAVCPHCGAALLINNGEINVKKEHEPITLKVLVDSKFQKGTAFNPEPWKIDSSFIDYLRNSQDIVRIQKTFSQIQNQHTNKSFLFRNSLLYTKADYKIFPSEYFELKDFLEISREIVPPLKVRKHDQTYTSEILDISRKEFLPANPLIFLDGVLIDEISQIISYGTKDIKKIEVIPSLCFIDSLKLNGILSVFSHNNLWKTVTENSKSLKLKAETFYEFPKLNIPDYSITDIHSREPDFRQLLYWNPNYQLMADKSAKIEFYTSDNVTSYLIKVSGVTDKGEKIEAYSEFQVTE